MGERDDVHPEMTEEVANSFLAEIRFNPDVAPIAARSWSPSHRNEQPWIGKMLAEQPGRRPPIRAHDPSKDPVN